MEISIPLDKMTIEEKLQILERVWEDLARTPEALPVPAWHADVLEARERRIAEGRSKFDDWDNAKNRIRERTR
jgi:hypothetical protein